jgi:hypothetical protein
VPVLAFCRCGGPAGVFCGRSFHIAHLGVVVGMLAVVDLLLVLRLRLLLDNGAEVCDIAAMVLRSGGDYWFGVSGQGSRNGHSGGRHRRKSGKRAVME